MESKYLSKTTQPNQSKTSLALSYFPFSDIGDERPKGGIEPRITRRMAKMASYSKAASGKCVICLGNYIEDFGQIQCGHTFCLECVKEWWKSHENCPFCREEILYVGTKTGQKIGREDLPPIEKNDRDEDFMPYCELCWGSIESFEDMNICNICRSVYWHQRCLPYRNSKWFCIECAGPGEFEEEEIDVQG